MQFGFTLKPDHSVERTLALTKRAEELGFDHVWLGDSSRMDRGWPRADCLPLLAAMDDANDFAANYLRSAVDAIAAASHEQLERREQRPCFQAYNDFFCTRSQSFFGCRWFCQTTIHK